MSFNGTSVKENESSPSEKTVRIIDTHTHVFPDKIALRAAKNVGSYYELEMSGDGTVDCLLECGKSLNATCVISSAALKLENVRAGNDFLLKAAEENERFVALGSVHPDMETEEAIKQLVYIKEHGAHGIKLHPDFQHFEIDTPRMIPVYKACSDLKLPILFHVGDENSDMSSPKRLYKVINLLPSLTVIAAHMGGYKAWDEAEEVLYGTNVYMDTSDAMMCLPHDRVWRQIERHGVNRIMFGSDYPLRKTDEAFALLDTLPFTDEQRERIYHGTAEEVFGIPLKTL